MNIDGLKDAVAQNRVHHFCLHKNPKGVVTVKVNCGIGPCGDPLLHANGSLVTFGDLRKAELTLAEEYGCNPNTFLMCRSPSC